VPAKRKKRQGKGEGKGKGEDGPLPYSEMSKADQERLMAEALQHERESMEKAGRVVGLPSCASIIEELEHSRMGKGGRKTTREGGGAGGGGGTNKPVPPKVAAGVAVGAVGGVVGGGGQPSAGSLLSPAGTKTLARLPNSTAKKKKKSRGGKRGGAEKFKVASESPWDFDASIDILDDVPPTTSD
jgi:hypothetical protein